ncbi:MAG: alpha-glucan family phosphorylase [Saprospiraceae bacterium]|nr:alpha-glucan family phosphorylase [Saprospiraceae bacterium]
MDMEKSFKLPYEPPAKYAKKVAYMSMEFAIDQALKTYSGGLGYLAGSHMRSAYQLKQNLVGIGMLWRCGYYDQERDGHGNMVAQFRRKYYTFLKHTGIVVDVIIKDTVVKVKALYLDPSIFGTVPMYFLTTDFAANDGLSRSIMNQLYHPNDATRVAQSIVLGIGGAKVMEELGGVDLYHINEAHALPVAFHLLSKYGSVAESKKHLVFTTHTPEMAGNSVMHIQLLNEMGFFGTNSLEKVREVTGMTGDHFEYTPAALRMSYLSNGVSKLHGEVAREMWQNYAGICMIKSITNAQDEKYWTDPILKKALEDNDDDTLITRKKELKKALFRVVADQEGDLFDENIFTIVWARRFAGYKRPDLILRDYERFVKLLQNTKFPVQIIWAGKPYPFDQSGINQFNFMTNLSYKNPNISVLTGYELGISAILKKGADIWLNTPRRPQEASGTSGMTAAMNGAINVSTNDGWIPEYAVDKENAFIVPEADTTMSFDDQDNHDNYYLMSLLENEIIPMYYEKPEQWLQMMKNSMQSVTPTFDSKRMADEYYEKLYNQDVI